MAHPNHGRKVVGVVLNYEVEASGREGIVVGIYSASVVQWLARLITNPLA